MEFLLLYINPSFLSYIAKLTCFSKPFTRYDCLGIYIHFFPHPLLLAGNKHQFPSACCPIHISYYKHSFSSNMPIPLSWASSISTIQKSIDECHKRIDWVKSFQCPKSGLSHFYEKIHKAIVLKRKLFQCPKSGLSHFYPVPLKPR